MCNVAKHMEFMELFEMYTVIFMTFHDLFLVSNETTKLMHFTVKTSR